MFAGELHLSVWSELKTTVEFVACMDLTVWFVPWGYPERIQCALSSFVEMLCNSIISHWVILSMWKTSNVVIVIDAVVFFGNSKFDCT